MFECNNIYSVWDKRLIRGVKNYRRLSKNVEYKGTRDEEKNARVFSHEELTTDLLNLLGVKNMYPGILEADDVIYWLANNIPGNKVVVSVDQDMLQLINDETIVYSPIKDVIIDSNNFESSVGVDRKNFIRYKSLIGDKSDNLPGLDRCGPKTASKLINECPTDVELQKKYDENTLKPYYTNLDLIDLSRGPIHHPDEPVIYEKQYKNLQSHEPVFDDFIDKCNDVGIRNIPKKSYDWKRVFDDDTKQTLESIVNKLNIPK